MGRYYSGDIEGKFWFGVQDSDDADHFGGTRNEPSFIEYDFQENDMPEIEEGIAACERELGGYKQKIDSFFEGRDSYNDKQLAEALGIAYVEFDYADAGYKQIKHLLEWYARLDLGIKIRDCVKEKGMCTFQAEL